VVCFLLAFQPKPYIGSCSSFSFLPSCMLHALPISSTLTWWF
jgi:hypothetical protein